MAIVAHAWPTVTGGVNQQTSSVASMGTHQEQINFIPSSIYGLVRRGGTVFKAAKVIPFSYNGLAEATSINWGKFEFTQGGEEYCLFYSREATSEPTNRLIVLWNKTAGIFMDVELDVDFLPILTLLGGLSSVALVGDVLLMSAKSVTPTYYEYDLFEGTGLGWSVSPVVTDHWPSNSMYAYVKTGAYNTTYSLSMEYAVVSPSFPTPSWVPLTISHTTPSSQFIDTNNDYNTASIASTDTEYTKKVNDIIHAYNKRVTEWITDAAFGILPSTIMANLSYQIYAALSPVAGATPAAALTTLVDNYMRIDHNTDRPTTLGTHIKLRNVRVTSSNDNGLMLFNNTVNDFTDLTPRAPAGKVLQVKGKNANPTYMLAIPKGITYRLGNDLKSMVSSAGVQSTPIREVTWVECPRKLIVPNFVFLLGAISRESTTNPTGTNTLYLASTPAKLRLLMEGKTANPVELPDYSTNHAGDYDSDPIPKMFKKPINHITSIQGRLLVCSGGSFQFSKSSDYFDFFRASTLATAADDAFEVSAVGAETDEIVSSVTIERNLLLFGKQKQYAISSRELLSPSNINIAVQNALKNDVLCDPVAGGSNVFFTKKSATGTSVYRLSGGDFADTFSSESMSVLLDDYIKGDASMIEYVADPQTVVLKTTGLTNGLYVASILQGRDGDAVSWWSATWHAELGSLVGMTEHNGKLQLIYVRNGRLNKAYWVVDELDLVGNSDAPCIDSQRPVDNVDVELSTSDTESYKYLGSTSVVFTDASKAYWGFPVTKAPLADSRIPEALWGSTLIGWAQPTPTVEVNNPRMLDKEGRSILSGRLTVQSVTLSLHDAGGVIVQVTPLNGATQTVLDNLNRDAGVTFIPSALELSDYQVTAHVGREWREYSMTIQGKSWYPLSISMMEWRGLMFSVRR